jgi:MoxR-like ATPase
MFEVLVDYPTEDEEFAIVRQTTSEVVPHIDKVLAHEDVASLQSIVRKVPVADHVIRYALQFARLTRRDQPSAPEFIAQYVSWGAGPRASQYLILGAKARAVLNGRTYASTDDVRAVAPPVLRHRIITNFNAEADGVSPDEIIRRLTKVVPTDPARARLSGRLPEVFKSADAG